MQAALRETQEVTSGYLINDVITFDPWLQSTTEPQNMNFSEGCMMVKFVPCKLCDVSKT